MKGEKAVLVVEDDPDMRITCARMLARAGFAPEAAEDGEAALAKLRSDPRFRIVLLDLKLPGINGTVVLEKIREIDPTIKVIIMTGFATIKSAVRTMKLGAVDYLVKPFEKDELLAVLAQQIHVGELEEKVERLQSELQGKFGFAGLVGRSAGMEHVFKQIVAASGNKANVLIVGESGTGKEVVAKAIHYNSSFAREPFVVVNCAALPEPLIESELFGYTKGAFTGATRDSAGLFRAAAGGTILLDEMFEMPQGTQAKLLRAIQERRIRPVGGVSEVPIDVRIIAATNQEPAGAIQRGRLRKDLFYRVSVITIRLPPLRERREDVCRFVDHFIDRFAKTYGFRMRPLHRQVLNILVRYSWPGNVRELEHVVEQWFAMGQKEEICVDDLPPEIVAEVRQTPDVATGTGLDDILSMREAERALVHKALQVADHNKSKAASLLGISRKKLYKLLGDEASPKTPPAGKDSV